MLTLAIQAGGESRRMGSDKGLLPFLGEALIQRVLKRLSGLADEVLVTSNYPERYHFLGVPIFPDIQPGRGALGGLHTALTCASQPLVAVVACDMPFASRDLLAHERFLLEEENFDAVLPASAQGLEPLHAVYRRQTCLPAVASALALGERKLIAWFPQVRVRTLSLAETTPFDPHGLAFMNVNTPEELQAAEKLALGE